MHQNAKYATLCYGAESTAYWGRINSISPCWWEGRWSPLPPPPRGRITVLGGADDGGRRRLGLQKWRSQYSRISMNLMHSKGPRGILGGVINALKSPVLCQFTPIPRFHSHRLTRPLSERYWRIVRSYTEVILWFPSITVHYMNM